ncbi:MAG: rRNA maturation RNase YbeY [Candidatus Eremiobacteraeota bacterium]|nr:rRNA maturation RNase YbeY [Candidatus Eremiobacteraeota bacterium]
MAAPRVLWQSPRLASVRADSLRRTVLATLRSAAPHVVGDVGVNLVDDATIRELNQRYRAIDTATDVLAFPLGDGCRCGEPFGDVIISYQTAARQARDYGAPLQRELQRLLIHGTLHLCGYDHHERRAAGRMHALTRRLLQAVADV